MRSRQIEERCGEVLVLWETNRAFTLHKLRVELAGIDLLRANSKLHRFFARYAMTRQNTGHAIEQDRPKILRQRQG